MRCRIDLPSFAIVDTAGQHDNKRAREVCAGIAPGEIVVFDKAYVDFAHLAHLAELDERGVQWVTRAKDTMIHHAKRNLTTDHENVIKDQIIVLKGKHKGMQVRRVRLGLKSRTSGA